MRLRWKDFEFPNKVFSEGDSTRSNYAKFIVEPFERGFGHTIGNSLRRILLSSLEGAAVTNVRIEGASHEVDVVFVIDEKIKVMVRQISFLGNDNIKAEELKAVMQTREGGELSWRPSRSISRSHSRTIRILSLAEQRLTVGSAKLRTLCLMSALGPGCVKTSTRSRRLEICSAFNPFRWETCWKLF